MRVRVTDAENVALYDSSSNEAFGPIFETKFQAEHFLSWHQKMYEAGELFQYGARRVQYAPDVRVYSNRMLMVVYNEWHKVYVERDDDDA